LVLPVNENFIHIVYLLLLFLRTAKVINLLYTPIQSQTFIIGWDCGRDAGAKCFSINVDRVNIGIFRAFGEKVCRQTKHLGGKVLPIENKGVDLHTLFNNLKTLKL